MYFTSHIMSQYFNSAEMFLDDLFLDVRLTKSHSLNFSFCNEYIVRGNNDRVAVCLLHLCVVQLNTRFSSFLPLKWQAGTRGGGGAAVDESPGI